ncbi:hypothetical protein [Thalassotalea marina]|uniref:Uncharacterized protein n=1 Tax=Thalassotalea marina TaxID=1673741 RepID=A0A919BR58_9GAMM|nr:hypothetical protein [Thalassotalea marina]GHG06983.1 hypothetical protein GCM10017161_40750 [Thalassotalea marina]
MRYSITDYQEGWEHLGILKTPADPHKLAQMFEAKIYGDRDGDGIRFWIPSLYILGGDIDTAKMYIDRYLEDYPDEYFLAAPQFIVSSLLIFIKTNKSCHINSTGDKHLRKMQAANLYLLPIILGRDITDKKISNLTNHSHFEFAASFPQWFYDLWTNEDKEILAKASDTVFNNMFIKTINEFRKELASLKPGQQRSDLIREQDYFLSLMTQ